MGRRSEYFQKVREPAQAYLKMVVFRQGVVAFRSLMLVFALLEFLRRAQASFRRQMADVPHHLAMMPEVFSAWNSEH
jgi:hypothetical protein